MSSVYLLDRDGRQMMFLAGPEVPEVWRQATSAFPATPTNSACGVAVDSRAQVIVPDMLTSPLFATLRDAVSASCLAGVWSTPFFSKDGDVLGTFAVFSHEPRRPDDRQLRLVDRATHLASIAVERHQTEEALRGRRQLSQTGSVLRIRFQRLGRMRYTTYCWFSKIGVTSSALLQVVMCSGRT
jgi:formate hydrogenlyase transcriptional activator